MAVKAKILSMWFPVVVSVLIIFRIAVYYYFVVNGGQYIHPDSALYLELAGQLIETGNFILPQYQPVIIDPFGILSENSGRVLQSNPPLGPDVFRTPGYPAFLVLLHWFGINNPYAIVFVQEIIYGLSIFIFYRYALPLFNKNIVRATVIFMLIGAGGLAWPKYLLSEALFFPFLLSGILCIGHYLRTCPRSLRAAVSCVRTERINRSLHGANEDFEHRPNATGSGAVDLEQVLKNSDGRLLVAAGILMGIGAWVRPAIQYFPLIAAVIIILFDIKNRKKWLHSAAMLFVFMLVISPWLMRNYYQHGQIYMSGQASNMIAHYHVPMVWNWENIIPYYEGQDLAQKKVAEVVKQTEHELGRSINAVEYFKLQQVWALKELSQYPATYLEHWLIGSHKTMYESFAIDFYDVMRFPDKRLHFSDILSGNYTADQAEGEIKVTGLATGLIYYLVHQDKFYLFHTVFSYLVFVFGLFGAISILLKRNCFLWIMMLACFYFTFIPGPMGYGRFRFPVDHFWFIQACMGFLWLAGLVKKVFLEKN
jgi:4-amino-4-deoxy-L-arabinose transferase-like glycosyltransferase